VLRLVITFRISPRARQKPGDIAAFRETAVIYRKK
jgi:hypothetical protein